jgi:hypothetical protein
MMEPMNTQSPIACDLTAIEPAERSAHQALAGHLLREAVLETRELVDGYAFRFPAELYPEIVGFIANERRCCAFFTFALEVAPDHGPIWLRITGPEGVKAILQGATGG